MLYLASYCFLLRLPLEALHMARGVAADDVTGQSVLWKVVLNVWVGRAEPLKVVLKVRARASKR